ncbi:MAG: TIGR02646 family protein [Bacteroidales bacterium]|nr:TIGR02646 family protein [Bacteroidales bacterium]
MRHINKSEPCQDFDNYVKEMYHNISLDNYIKNTSVKKHPWKRLNNEIKETLAKHLFAEQKGLCIYCQQSLINALPNILLSETVHVEHLKPKTRDKYPQETFNQKNLTLSCNGFDCKNEKGTSEFCGHKKLEEYYSAFFLNPVEIEDIEKYFEYTFEGEIYPSEVLSEKEKIKAEYMINILGINHSRLSDMRKENLTNIITIHKDEIEQVLDENVENLPSFYSMLKQLLK